MGSGQFEILDFRGKGPSMSLKNTRNTATEIIDIHQGLSTSGNKKINIQAHQGIRCQRFGLGGTSMSNPRVCCLLRCLLATCLSFCAHRSHRSLMPRSGAALSRRAARLLRQILLRRGCMSLSLQRARNSTRTFRGRLLATSSLTAIYVALGLLSHLCTGASFFGSRQLHS